MRLILFLVLVSLLLLPLLGFSASTNSSSSSSYSYDSLNCRAVYKNGGAPAVHRYPKCAPAEAAAVGEGEGKEECHVSVNQGKRRSQEDRAFCDLNFRVPFPSIEGTQNLNIGLVAIFDGHEGAEASEMASSLFPKYFFLNLYYILDGTYRIAASEMSEMWPYNGQVEGIFEQSEFLSSEIEKHEVYFQRSNELTTKVLDESFYREVLKEALLRTIHDLDATFYEEAVKSNLGSGTTAVIAIKAMDHILVANVGDSKALLCSQQFGSCYKDREQAIRARILQRSAAGASGSRREKYKLVEDPSSPGLCAKELTRDHHPDRDDERLRVEQAGGTVVEWNGVARVNGRLAVSRSIGDLPMKRYGVISVPELTGWLPLSGNDTYLVAGSDGVFDKLTPQDVCDLFPLETTELDNTPPYSLADIVLRHALERNCLDNLSAIVVPLSSSATMKKNESTLRDDAR